MTWIAFGLSAVILVLAAALRSGGASLVRTPRADALHDAAEGNEQAQRVARLLVDRARIQPSISVVHAAALVAAALPAAWALTALLSGWPLVIGLLLLGVFVVFVGELLPRTLGRDRPRSLAYRLSWLLDIAARVGDKAADMISDLDEDDDEETAVEDEDEEHRKEIQLISSVLEFSDTIVREVMVPRTDMLTVERDLTSEDALDVVVEHGFSRVPVTGEGVDDIVGVVYAKDLLRLMDEGSGPVGIGGLMRAAYFVPETKPVPDLLRDMQTSKVHMAIVVDEFGGTAGLVTIEDLLEELVGEIVDEYDTEAPMVVRVDDGYLIDARLSVDDLNELLGTDLPDEEWDTVAGLILELAGRVPHEGERFEYDSISLVAERVQGRRVERVRVGVGSGTRERSSR